MAIYRVSGSDASPVEETTFHAEGSLIDQPGQRWVLTLGTRTPRAWCFLDRRQS